MAGEPAETDAAAAPSAKRRMVPFLIVALLMVGEGVGVFFLAKAINPAPVSAFAGGAGGGQPRDGGTVTGGLAEVAVAECRPSNMMAGKFVTFHIRVSGLVASVDEERAKDLVRANQSRLEDGVNTVIRKAQPNHLGEPGLETIRRRLKHEFDGIFDDEQLIKRVLIPQMLQSGPGV